jgi:hypothetical protein
VRRRALSRACSATSRRLRSVAFCRGRLGGDRRRKGTAVSEAWDDAELLPALDDELELELEEDDDDDDWDEEDDGDDED